MELHSSFVPGKFSKQLIWIARDLRSATGQTRLRWYPQQRELYLEPPRNLPRILPEASLYNRHLPFPEPFWSPHKNLPEFLCSLRFGWDLIAFRCWGKNLSHQASPKVRRHQFIELHFDVLISEIWFNFKTLDITWIYNWQCPPPHSKIRTCTPTRSLLSQKLGLHVGQGNLVFCTGHLRGKNRTTSPPFLPECCTPPRLGQLHPLHQLPS